MTTMGALASVLLLLVLGGRAETGTGGCVGEGDDRCVLPRALRFSIDDEPLKDIGGGCA
jgi:hypothetical protein